MTHWWQKAVFYQIYPRSFYDRNGDGIGDIQGIIEKLDYLGWLGVNAIWLSPHYPSPQIDIGYDVADYTAVNPDYGTLDVFKSMLDLMNERGMRLVIDLVLNHTSDQHRWFQESKSSRDHSKRDWYIWRDGVHGQPPNNWESTFGGSAWQYDETTDQYYYHFFLKEQPDLNWRNPEVKEAMFDAMRFWLNMGVDGFRLDAIGTIYEDEDLTPHNSEYNAFDVLRGFWLGKQSGYKPGEVEAIKTSLQGNQVDLPEIHDLMRDLRKLVDSYSDRILIGETRTMALLGTGKDELHTIFNFDLLSFDHLTPKIIRDNQGYWLSNLPHGAWYCNTLNNHDQSRVKTHYGDGEHDEGIARVSAALMLTLSGTPFLYYGEEIGMEDYSVQSFNEIRDSVSFVYRNMLQRAGKSDHEILADLAHFSRDRCRTPMQWNNKANAGFSPEGVETWLPVHENHTGAVNVEDQQKNRSTLLHFYRRLIHARRRSPALSVGTYQAVDVENDHYLAFLRTAEGETVLVLINFTATEQVVAYDTSGMRVRFPEVDRTKILAAEITLQPFEVLIAEV
jgi:alpha-glucosidase